MKSVSLKLVLTLTSVLVLGACSETAIDKVADAQACLDQATASNVSECLSKVDGVNTKGAYLIRCSAKFIEEGFNDPVKLTNALSAVESNSGGTGTTNAMDALSFSSVQNAKDAATYCAQAESKGLIMLSSMAKMATVLKDVSGGNINTAINTCAIGGCNQDTLIALGQAATIAYQSNCANGGESLGSVCEQFGSVVDSGDSEAIGLHLAQCLNGTGSGCSGF